MGTVLDGRYRIERLLGRGRTGPVYQGQRLGIERRVAVRVLVHRGGVSAEDLARRLSDAGHLDHPSCVAVSDHGTTAAGHTYVVTDLVVGTRLVDEIARAGRIPAYRALPIARHLLRGLRHAHGRGLIHGELASDDVILVDQDGDADVARMLGFGTLKPVTVPAGDRLAALGPVFGTPSYMAPEQALGKLVDARADLYAVATILYEMLTGAPPFRGDDVVEVLRQQVTGIVPALTPAVAPEVEALVHRGLAKDPSERPPSAAAYLEAIEQCLTQLGARDEAATQRLPASRRSPTSDTTVRRAVAAARPRPRRRRLLAGTVVAAAVAAAALLVADAVPGRAPARPGPMAAALVDGGRPRLAAETRPEPAAAPTSAPAPAPVPAPTPVAAAAAPPPAAPPPPWQDALDAAVAAAEQGRFGAAEDALHMLVETFPDDAPLRQALGDVYLARNWPAPALEAYRAALARDPSLRTSPALITAVVSLLDSNSRWWDAARFLTDLGAPAVPILTTAATTDRSGLIRRRARGLLERLGAPVPATADRRASR